MRPQRGMMVLGMRNGPAQQAARPRCSHVSSIPPRDSDRMRQRSTPLSVARRSPERPQRSTLLQSASAMTHRKTDPKSAESPHQPDATRARAIGSDGAVQRLAMFLAVRSTRSGRVARIRLTFFSGTDSIAANARLTSAPPRRSPVWATRAFRWRAPSASPDQPGLLVRRAVAAVRVG